MLAQAAKSDHKILVIACGALAPELTTLINLNDWAHIDVKCLPAEYHNYPDKILPGIKKLVDSYGDKYNQILIGYSDCGTGGQLDDYIQEQGFERLPGMHCYEMFSGHDVFNELHARELGTFYLTDYLARNFQRLIIDGMGISAHPELESMYFGSYKKLVYLAQSDDAQLDAKAKAAAKRLGLEYERIYTGLSKLETALQVTVNPHPSINRQQKEIA